MVCYLGYGVGREFLGIGGIGLWDDDSGYDVIIIWVCVIFDSFVCGF